jgi:hypothetical protein
MSTEPGPGLVPEHLRPRYEGDPILMTVDGQQFRIRTRAGEPGTHDFDWLNGPREYGFTVSASGGWVMSRSEMAQTIREVLADIDPATGYLRE